MNPMQMLQMFQSNNPFMLMRQFAGNDTEKINFINNLEKQNPQEWEQVARNLAQSKGVPIENVINNIRNLQNFNFKQYPSYNNTGMRQ